MSTFFKGAERNAYNIDWIVRSEATPDDEMYEGDSLVTLRERSRQLVKDNPLIAGLQQMYINLVGTPSATRIKKASSQLLQRQAQERLNEFNADLSFDNLTFDEVIEQIVSCSFLEGDLLISLPLDKQRQEGKQTVVELIEGNRVKTPSDLQRNKDIRNGVQYDSEGRVLGYYVKKYDKIGNYGDQSGSFDFFPRIKGNRVVTQLFKAPLNSRPKMSRQYPIITPIIQLIKHMDDYLEAIIVGARVAACFAGFITTNNPAKAAASMTTDGGGTITDPRDTYGERRVTK
jgi:capsid protein